MTKRKGSPSDGWPKPYVEKCSRAKAMRGQSGRVLWDRLRLLTDIFTDQAWRDHIEQTLGGRPDDLALEKLITAEFLGDFSGIFDFADFRKILRYFPNPQGWQMRPLREMFEQSRPTGASSEPKTTRWNVIAEWDRMQAELEHYKRRVADLQAQLRGLMQNDRLQ